MTEFIFSKKDDNGLDRFFDIDIENHSVHLTEELFTFLMSELGWIIEYCESDSDQR